MRYTVFGIVDVNTGGLTVAAVVEGDVKAVDIDPNEGSGSDIMRWGAPFEAGSPAEAESFAQDQLDKSWGVSRPQQLWNSHSNGLGDWCPWSRTGVREEDGDTCPAMCKDAEVAED